MLWVIQCFDRPGAAKLRADTRPAHLEYLQKYKTRLLYAGPIVADDGEAVLGSLLLINMASRAEVETFSRNDPYTKAGLFESAIIRRTRATMLEPAAGVD